MPLIPRKVATQGPSKLTSTAEFFVASTRRNFDKLPDLVAELDVDDPAAEQLRRFEDFQDFTAESKLRSIPDGNRLPWLEVVLHTGSVKSADYIIAGFRNYLKGMNISVDLDRRLHVGNLCFLPLQAPRGMVNEIARYSFLRVVRGMPKLRPPHVTRSISQSVFLGPNAVPSGQPIDPGLRIAIFDGGVGENPVMNRYVNSWRSPGLEKPAPKYEEHGHMVTGAVLFGPIENPNSLPIPFGVADHYRVLDVNTDSNDDQLFDVIHRIETAILERKPEFIVLSIGPDMVIDDEPHIWTSKLDQLLSGGDILAAVAVGNSGEADQAKGLHRIQVPSDAVNSLSIGACDSRGNKWARAPYSSIGPGRSPGRVKPDVLAFGGSKDEPFYVLSQKSPGEVVPQFGTSFAGPLAMRTAAGIRAYLGAYMKPLVLKALLINRSHRNEQPLTETGWGRIEEDVESLITCADNEAVIIYQGELDPGNYWAAEIPWPDGEIKGNVEIRATFCFACQTDPEHPVHYTRAGLEVVFRPDSRKFLNPKAQLPASETLFGKIKPYATELELRKDAHKWETTIHGIKRKRANKIHKPSLQIHYNARSRGSSTSTAKNVPYALVLTVHADKDAKFYDRVLQKYRQELVVLQPVRIPVRL